MSVIDSLKESSLKELLKLHSEAIQYLIDSKLKDHPPDIVSNNQLLVDLIRKEIAERREILFF